MIPGPVDEQLLQTARWRLLAASDAADPRVFSAELAGVADALAGTEPSTEFSSGTSAASRSPERTAPSAVATLPSGRALRTAGPPGSPVSLTRAASAKVPSGPR